MTRMCLSDKIKIQRNSYWRCAEVKVEKNHLCSLLRNCYVVQKLCMYNKATTTHNKQKSAVWAKVLLSLWWCTQSVCVFRTEATVKSRDTIWVNTASNTSDSLCGCEFFHVHPCIHYFSIAVIKHYDQASYKWNHLSGLIPEVRVWAGRAKAWLQEQRAETSLEAQVQAERANWNVTRS